MVVNIFKKLILTFKWVFGIKLSLKEPIDGFLYQDKKNNSIGDWYQKIINFSKKLEIKSPIEGKIGKIYLNNSASLITGYGLEIILLLNLDDGDRNLQVKFLKNEEEKIEVGEIILTVEPKEGKDKVVEANVSIIVPWQPLLISRIEKGLISYRNPFVPLKVKNARGYR